MCAEPLSRKELARLHRQTLREALTAARAGATGAALETQLKALANVKQLSEASSAVTAKQRQWWLARLVPAAVALVLVLASVHISAVRIDFHARSSRTMVTSKATQNLTVTLAAKEVDVVGNFALDDAPAVMNLPAEMRHLRLRAEGADPIVIEPVQIAAGDRVTVERGSGEGRFLLQVESARPMSVALTVSGRVRVSGDAASFAGDLPMARPLSVTSRPSEPINLAFTTGDPTLTNAISIEGLELEKLETIGDVPRRVSAVANGRIEFPDYENRVVPVNRREQVVFGGLDAVLAPVEMDEGELAIHVAGTAERIDLGPQPAPRSQVPSVLEQITKQADWVLVTGSLGALLAVLWSMWMNPK